jgi:hypothetical protein
MIMCHMIADDENELHEMAQRIGIRRKWFQNQGRYPHYDICKSKRALAVKHGAVEVSSRELVLHARRIKADREFGQPHHGHTYEG